MYSIPDDGFKTSCFLLWFRADDPCQFLASNVAKTFWSIFTLWMIYNHQHMHFAGRYCFQPCLSVKGGSHVRTCSNSFIWGPPGLSPLPFYTNHMNTWNPPIPQTRSNIFTWQISPGPVFLFSVGTCWQVGYWPSTERPSLFVFTLKVSDALPL